MKMSEQVIREHALARIAKIFGVPIEQLPENGEFGKCLNASFVSDFRDNEFDQVLDDIHYVADRRIKKELSAGILTINTVKDYCDHMVRCYGSKPRRVSTALDLGKSEQNQPLGK